ncbi:zinc finger, CCHC-type containing protein [Tanacetum coccineum]
MLMTMESDIQRNLENLGAYEMLQELKTLFAQQAEEELLQTMQEFHSCKQEEGHMGKTINELHDMLKLHEQTLPKNNAHALHAIRVDIRVIRILLAIAAYYNYEIWQMDVKTAFLNGYLSEEVYMEQPEEFSELHWTSCKTVLKFLGYKTPFLVLQR